jgi:hypothetical protein
LFLSFFYLFCMGFFCGCQNTDLLEKYPIFLDPLQVEIHRSEEFPQSLAYRDLLEKHLLAGRREGISFYFEFYRLGSPQNDEKSVLAQGKWKKNSKGTSIRKESRLVLGETFRELVFFQKIYPTVIFGAFLFKGNPPLHEILPTVLD